MSKKMTKMENRRKKIKGREEKKRRREVENQPWLGSSAGYSVLLIGQGCGFDPQLGHMPMNVSVSETTNLPLSNKPTKLKKKKKERIKPRSPLSSYKFQKKKRRRYELENCHRKMRHFPKYEGHKFPS